MAKRKPRRDRDAESRSARAKRYAQSRAGRSALAGAGVAAVGAVGAGGYAAGRRKQRNSAERKATRQRHPSVGGAAGARSVGARIGARTGRGAAAFGRSAGQAYRTSGGPWPSPKAKRKAAAYGGAAVAGAGAYGLVKARAGRSTQQTNVNINTGGTRPASRRRGYRRPFKVRRDRNGRFR